MAISYLLKQLEGLQQHEGLEGNFSRGKETLTECPWWCERAFHGVRPEGAFGGMRPEGAFGGVRPEGAFGGVRPEGAFGGVRPEGPFVV